MKDILSNSMFFGVLVSILAYEVGVLLKKKLKFALLNPLLISIVIIILILVILVKLVISPLTYKITQAAPAAAAVPRF